jgi:hypothetical protein
MKEWGEFSVKGHYLLADKLNRLERQGWEIYQILKVEDLCVIVCFRDQEETPEE